jgi:hypothetical protein
MLYQISDKEIQELIAIGTQIGIQRGLEFIGEKPRVISQNRAYRQFTQGRLKNWIKEGRISAMPNGNGKTSTKYYDYATLLALDQSDKIIIHKC